MTRLRTALRTRDHAELPSGPAMPSALQAAAWALRPLAFMERAGQRYGEIFTLRIRRGRPWVFLTNPEHVKKVFTTDSELLRAGAGKQIRCSNRCLDRAR